MRLYAVVACPACLAAENREVAMTCYWRLSSLSPEQQAHRERIDGASYDYRCAVCGLGLNYPRRLRA